MLRIVNDVLDMAKIDNGRMEFECIPVNLRELCGMVLLANREIARQKGIQLHQDIEAAVPLRIEGDPTRILQVLTNLISNAIKFTAQGFVSLRVMCLPASVVHRVQLMFVIQDTGSGIPQGALASLFEPYTQAKVSISRQFGGTGLGLSICKRIVQHMNGDIQVHTEVGVGTTFTVRVEVPVARSMSINDRVGQNVETTVASNFAGAHILVVDDQATNVTILKRMLERSFPGVCVFTGFNGQEALNIMRDHEYRMDLLLMDVHMPLMDGYSATKQLRDSDCQVPIIAVTANAMNDDVEACLKAGMNAVMLKPFRKEQLEQIMQKYCKCTSPTAIVVATEQILPQDRQSST